MTEYRRNQTCPDCGALYSSNRLKCEPCLWTDHIAKMEKKKPLRLLAYRDNIIRIAQEEERIRAAGLSPRNTPVNKVEAAGIKVAPISTKGIQKLLRRTKCTH